MASTGATLPAQFKPDQLFSNFDLLQKAIQFGDVEKAKQIVSDLAKNKASVEVTEKQDKLQLRNDDEISVKIYIEDKDLSGSQLTMKIATSLKIKELKMMMLKNHGFAPEIQKWIIGKKIVKDEDTLYRLRVKSGSAMYLYLLSPQSVGLSREVYAQKYGADLPYGTPGLPVTQEEGVRFQRLPRSTAPPTPQNNARVNVRESTGNGDYMVPLQSPPPLLRTNPPPAQPVQPPAPQEPERLHYTDVGWTCPQCTYKNEPTRPGCEMCSHDRPDDYTMPDGVEYEMTDKEKRRLQREKDTERLAEQVRRQQEEENARMRSQNYDSLLASFERDIITNEEEFDCPICFDTVQTGQGVRLRECLHQFCRLCLAAQVVASEDPQIKCPHQDEDYSCPSVLLDREIKALVTPDAFEKYLQRSLSQAESQAANSFHCKTTDCHGWCLYDDDVNFFNCTVCGKKNCLTCKTIHEGQNCKEYQEDLRINAQNDDDAKKTNDALKEMLQKGDAMECPQCRVVITKKQGCDWLRCTMCKTEICWVTKGRRWGPNGTGDTSGGCKCNFNQGKCHPRCQNCH